ncbi:uncharacterized protein SAPINGB_P005693 [Magnusiomyces paraingens]|uniref:Fe2OG dioxygenase domain-containing protein n=1 Tax=Magnusiomyces paraingens TaxID=2606893 RepID=A0A5E8C1A0_9ASCO|nr:uncharacterized protein SAPINGB_P005693 [Saprochaete ingens]VVT57433.1 unnamed protein product [Saprochaete ingens]
MTNTEKVQDIFRPLYKRDRHLQAPEMCAEILDLRQAAQNNIGPPGYRIRVSRYYPTDSAISHAKSVFSSYIESAPESVAMKLQEALTEELENHYDPVQITVDELPGLVLIPELLPHAAQCAAVAEIVRDLVPDTRHRNNLDIHYSMGSGLSLFEKDKVLEPLAEPIYMGEDNKAEGCMIDASATRSELPASITPMPIAMVRMRKLRWITLGGQYNWTTKKYPTFTRGAEGFPEFPARMGSLFSEPVFPGLTPEAAIINFYSPGDTLSPHRDVAELCMADLVSVSIGCEAVFYAGMERYSGQQQQQGTEVLQPLQMLLRSGDAVVMGSNSRHAYHGVGKVWAKTCPDYLKSLDNFVIGDDEEHELWRRYGEWMANKRVNINVRQML